MVEGSATVEQKWTTVLLFVRMMGRELHGRLAVAAGIASGYSVLSVSLLVCVIVAAVYVFMRDLGKPDEKDYGQTGLDDGEIHHSPHPVAARPKTNNHRQGYASRLFKPHSMSPRSTSGP